MKWFFCFLVVFFIYFLLNFNKSRSFIHRELNIHPSQIESDSPLLYQAKTKYVYNSDNQKIAFYSFPVRKPKAIIILAHGYSNPGGKNQMLSHVAYLNEASYSVYLLDFRSFGESDGQKIYLGSKEWQDLESLYNYISSLSENYGKKIGYLGFSMGAVSAVNSVAKTGKGDFIIAVVPYASIDSLFQFRLKKNIFSSFFFTKAALIAELGTDSQKISPENLISKIEIPIIIFSAKNDTQINPSDPEKLYNLINTNLQKEFWQADSDHNIFSTLPDEFEQHVLSFLAKI